MNDAAWTALVVGLTLIGGAWTWLAFRRRGPAHGLRALGVTLLPAAAWLTGTLRMFSEIGDSIASWAGNLVFDPRTWTGIGLAGLAVLLILVSSWWRERQAARGRSGAAALPSGSSSPADKRAVTGSTPGATKNPGSQAASGDDDLDDIEALLRKRGIE